MSKEDCKIFKSNDDLVYLVLKEVLFIGTNIIKLIIVT